MSEEQIYYDQVTITEIRHLSDRWIHFSLQSTDPAQTNMRKYYQYKEVEDPLKFHTGATIWRVGLCKDSDIMTSIEKGSYSCIIY